MLHISHNTSDLGLKRPEQTGDCRAVTGFQTGSQHKITAWDCFRVFVQQQGGKTQAQMAQLWGDHVTQQSISDALRKIGRTERVSWMQSTILYLSQS
jgi:hypothetical protein